MKKQLIENEIVMSLENIEPEEGLEPRPDLVNTDPPPQEGKCDCCEKAVSELKPFGKAGDPLVGDFDGILLICKLRFLFPQNEELEMIWADYRRHEDAAGSEKAEQAMIQKFGEKKIDLMKTYNKWKYEYVDSWECRDCTCLDDEEYFEELEKHLPEGSTCIFGTVTS